MVLKDILSISGEQGLFKFIAQGKNAIIVEHLETKKRSSAYGSAKVSSLEDIAIFTDTEDLSLGKVFDLIYDKSEGGSAVDPKSDPQALKAWFEEILPDYSRDKVYVSDIRKVAQWYNILQKLDMLVKEDPEAENENEETDSPEEKKETEVKEEKKPAAGEKKSARKKKPE
ncbi:MAG TPA: DUF5606 domain-containing protein [Bacteroidales bacterium]|nr:DUF5606 domain-containing protein [Bacteroidales bacterium]